MSSEGTVKEKVEDEDERRVEEDGKERCEQEKTRLVR